MAVFARVLSARLLRVQGVHMQPNVRRALSLQVNKQVIILAYTKYLYNGLKCVHKLMALKHNHSFLGQLLVENIF